MEVPLMSPLKKTGIVLLGLAVMIVLAGSVACQKKAATGNKAETLKSVTEFDGMVLAALGRYMYLSTAQGFDIILPGFDAATLMGKNIRVKGNLLVDHPSIFLADSVELLAEDFIETKSRDTVPILVISGINKPEEWEGKGLVKIYGQLQKGDVTYVVLSDDKGKESAKIIVDSFTTFASYYLKKLRLFDKFWFYLNAKDSVDRRIRTRTKEIFHADVAGVGLY
jgi:hypothetical protein